MRNVFKALVATTFFLLVLIFLQGYDRDPRLIPARICESYNLPQGVSNSQKQRADRDNAYTRELLYEERRARIEDGCRKVNSTPVKGSINFTEILVDKIHNIYYCPITKVSSTFWRRVLLALASHGKFDSPFSRSFGGVKLSKLKQLSEEEIRNLREYGTSFMFVRDPYARLFSGYENKIYHANLMFWQIIGREVVHVIRSADDDIYKNYGFDVTFPEFIKYILYLGESGKPINEHFSPMNRKCDPCLVEFQYIGKLETLEDDADFLISKWKKQFPDITLRFNDFQMEAALDTAKGRVNFLFQTKKILDEIKFPFIRIMLRTWRDLQIRGYLSKYIDFPYKESDANSVTKEEFFEAVKRALSIPVNRTEVKQQREEAFIQAYRQVPIEDLERLRNYVLKDCLLFGYDDRPKIIFDRTVDFVSDFTYLDGL